MAELPIFKVPQAIAAQVADLEARVRRMEARLGVPSFQVMLGRDGIEYTTLWTPEYFATYDVGRNAWFDRDTGALVMPMELAPKELQPAGWVYVQLPAPTSTAPAPSPEPYASL